MHRILALSLTIFLLTSAIAMADTVPVNTAPPTITGNPVVGQTLTEHHGQWNPAPAVYRYWWLRCTAGQPNKPCSVLTRAQTYVVQAADVGHTLRVREYARNSAGQHGPGTSSAPTVTVTPGTTSFQHDPSFVPPSYYTQWSHGPSSSATHFPICAYQEPLDHWGQLAPRMVAMGVNCNDDAYQAEPGEYSIGQQNGLTFNIDGGNPASSTAVTSYATADEPNQQGDPYSWYACPGSPPSSQAALDPCSQAFHNSANAYRSSDLTRPVWGNLGKEVDPWAQWGCCGWSTQQVIWHVQQEISSLDIVSADYYAWTDPYEVDQTHYGQSTCVPGASTHCGAWVYGATVHNLAALAPGKPVYAFVECCGVSSGSPWNDMTPNMISTAAWNALVHGARGLVWWTADFWDSHGDPHDSAYPGASYNEYYALFSDHQWDAQYAAAQAVDAQIQQNVSALNSPTVLGISASATTPVATLGKDVGGKLWLLAQADGDSSHQLSNTTPISATITVPVPSGTVFDVLGENRTVTVNAQHQIVDTFGTVTDTPRYSGVPVTFGYQHHIYQER